MTERIRNDRTAQAIGLVALAFIFLAGLALFSAAPSEAQQPNATDVAARRAELEKELKHLEELMAKQQDLLNGKRGERQSLERDLSIIEAEIEKSQLAIKARELEIAKLTSEITRKEYTLRELEERLAQEKEALADFIRQTDEVDDATLLEIILSHQTLSDFFAEVGDVKDVKVALAQSYEEITKVQESTRIEKASLEDKRVGEVELKTLQTLEQDKIEEQEAQKERLLNITKGQEDLYADQLQKTQQSAAEIRAMLFELQGSAAIPFGQALELANFASQKTGVRPALILGVLKQETKLGEFLGNGNWQSDMHPTRDRPLFQVIAKTLGFTPDSVPVSAKPGYGWGGAMGPSQFIPTTWACYGGFINTRTGDCSNSARSITMDDFYSGPWIYDSSKDRIRALVGKGSPSNPYENRDAFMATGMLMMDNGAAAGGHRAEWLAAQRYFAGWANAENPAYSFYGDSVMQHAAFFQSQIDTLKELEG
jgi:peptidoglycan hydrolase CwlO-like protein